MIYQDIHELRKQMNATQAKMKNKQIVLSNKPFIVVHFMLRQNKNHIYLQCLNMNCLL